MKQKINYENYQEQYFMRCNYINVTKNFLKNLLLDYGYELDKEKIFEKDNPNLFLNVLYGEEKKATLHFYLNDEIHEYKMKEEDYNFLNSFYDEFVDSKLYETSLTELKDKIGTNIGLLIEEMLDKESDSQ